MHRFKSLFSGAATLALLVVASAPRAQGAPEDTGALIALELPEAQALAVTGQPLLQAQAAAVRAAREGAVAAAQLPDPQLMLEVQDVPANGPDAGSFTRDSDTQAMVGFSQEFPAGDTRRLRGLRAQREADAAEQSLAAARLQVQRDVGLAWVDAWHSEQALALVRRSRDEAKLQAQAVEIAYSTGRATQADLLAARVGRDLAEDEAANLEQQVAHYRSALSRWIPADADRPLCPELPDWRAPPELPALLERLASHPELALAARQVDVAAAEAEIARQAYKPGWRAGIAYGYRPNFPEMVSLQLGVDLPVFTSKRQDRTLAAKLAEREQAGQARDDRFRQLAAEARLNRQDWDLLQQRLKRFDEQVLPQSEQRVAAALAAWQNGQATLDTVLAARRMALENQLKRLELQVDAARHQLNLQYLAGESL